MSKLFQPINVGNVQLKHRLVMAPLTRFRVDLDHVPLPNTVEYYSQRASEPGTLIIVEATSIAPEYASDNHTPGIWSEAQVEAFKKITAAIHARGSSAFLQINHPGRAGGRGEEVPLFSSSAVPLEEGGIVPRELTETEIWKVIRLFTQAAKSAIRAGFDGVELHGANGYLIDQFLQTNVNRRTDAWGGSVENRSRFVLELVRSVAAAIGNDRLGIRFSPWSTFNGMKMDESLTVAQFSHVLRELKPLGLAYLHLIESRVFDSVDIEKKEGLEFAFDIWANQSPILVAGGFTAASARKAVDEEYKDHDTLVVFGRHFVSTPDLVFRLRNGIAFNPYDRSTFYTPMQDEGYIDYEFSNEYRESIAA